MAEFSTNSKLAKGKLSAIVDGRPLLIKQENQELIDMQEELKKTKTQGRKDSLGEEGRRGKGRVCRDQDQGYAIGIS